MDQEKLKNIQKRIKEFKATENSNLKSKQEINAFTIGVDLVAGTMVGVFIGITIDKLFNSKPLFLILCMIIGIIAGFNIIRQKLKITNKR
ncbi:MULTISPECIES: AtpZ/AtpI family protein [unclassified Rickettsia]|uniref:AtpZ/AtpI family protein n=1 Tax=unclassified Rickettsia TaxID=114295 RepID=UPI00209E49C1|nr:AtpZ/AtpI family protein [Rickettsia endosymbiont of Ceutorhynchus assimilis]